MKRRSPAAPLLLPIITFGIYSLVWLVKTKNEMNKSITSGIPSAWLLIVPIGNIFWYVSYARGVKEFTRTGSTAGTFFLLVLLSAIGCAIVQARFNRAIGGAATSSFAPAVAVA
jgi:prepilin signal peptidase PulO-like enzyme (type II secretory pathway)